MTSTGTKFSMATRTTAVVHRVQEELQLGRGLFAT